MPSRGESLMDGVIQNGQGRIGAGGPAGYGDYRERAPLNTARGVIGDPELTQRTGLPERRTTSPADKGLDAATDDLMGDFRAATGENWVNTARVDKVDKATPFYWWRIGTAKLAKGTYELRVSPEGAVDAAAPHRQRRPTRSRSGSRRRRRAFSCRRRSPRRARRSSRSSGTTSSPVGRAPDIA